MTILVIGRQGQLAQSLAATGRPDLVCIGRPECDLTCAARIDAVLNDTRPSIVINAAAYTAVDGAERDTAASFAVNRDGPAVLAQQCAERGIPLIHISTDMVFDGSKGGPYEPADAPRPLGVYGQSKLEGELAVAAALPQHLIVRVQWVFSEYASNFVRTMLTLAQTREEVTVVNDQVGYPSYCPDLAAGLLAMADAARKPGFSAWGIFHLAGREETDRASMANAVFEASHMINGPVARVIGVPTSVYITPAKRPLNARLGSRKAEEVFGIALPDWRAGLRRSVSTIVRELKAMHVRQD